LINDANCGKVNYCSKQSKDSDYLQPVIDTKGHTCNGNSKFLSTDTSNTKWRYATKEEADEYERIGKPYDVTTLKSKEKSIPEYVECIKPKVGFTVGKIYNWPYPLDDDKDTRCLIQFNECFKPSTKEAYEAQFAAKEKEFKEEQFKVGDYCARGNFIFIKVEKNPYKCNNYALNRRDKEYYAGNAHMQVYNSSPTRHATQGEKDWLDAWIKARKFVTNAPIIEERLYGGPLTFGIDRFQMTDIKKETFIDDVQSVNVTLRTKKKTIKF
jgi:hypothetical protein